MTQENALARYTIQHDLGRGALGAVYSARDRISGKVVALKRLDPAQASLAERFLKQANSAKQLKHRNIVQIHDAGTAAGTAYVTMEYLEGESLRKMLAAGPLPIARALHIAKEIASGLAYAHLQGAVHGGIKASNIIVTPSGAVKITDFGIGQIAQREPLDHRTDIFALGALLYEMLTHRPPSGKAPQPPSYINANVPHALDAIVLKMLAPDPADRMAGVPILLTELQRLEEGLGLGTEPNVVAPANAGAQQEPPIPEDRAEPRLQEPIDFGGVRPGAQAAESVHERIRIAAERDEFDYRRAMMDREYRREREQPSSWSKHAMFAALLLVPAALAGAGYVYYLSLDPSAPAPVALRSAIDSKDPIAAFGKWEATPPWARKAEAPIQEAPKQEVVAEPEPPKQEVVAKQEAVKPEPAPLNTPRPVAPPPVARSIEPPAAAPAPAPAGSGLTLPPSIAEAPSTSAPAPEAAAPPPPPPPERVAVAKAIPTAKAESPAKIASAPPAQEAPRPSRTVTVTAERPAGTAQLILAVNPAGELYINGEHLGTTPPMKTLNLEPGMHQIEVRSGSRTPYLTYMTVQAGDIRRITHDFNAKPSRPPVNERATVDRPSR